MAKALEYFVTAGRQAIDAGGLRSFRLGCPQPATLSHAREDRIQRSRTQAVPVMVQLFQHPLAIDTASVSGMVKDVNLPEPQQEFSRYRIAHRRKMIARRFVIEKRLRQLVSQ